MDVVFPVAHPFPLTYRVEGEVPVGSRVRAPLRGKERVGFVYSHTSPPEGVRVLEAVPLDREPLLPPNMVELVKWVSSYYLEPPGVVFAAAVAPYLRDGRTPPASRGRLVVRLVGEAEGLTPRQRELVALLREKGELPVAEVERVWGISRAVVKALVAKGVVEERVAGTDAGCPSPLEEEIELTEEQAGVIEQVASAFGGFSRFLLHGVTGSGKTEVYKRLAKLVLDRGGCALILVPEISLTPHYVKRFLSLFGNTLAVLHSGLSDAERARQWMGIREGRFRLVVGTRSAVFAPFRCSLIVVDEEHDPSYKQQESPRYNARDVAVMRAKMEGCPVVLGSATPSVESYHNALRSKYVLLRLTKRVAGGSTPRVHLVDMREERGVLSDFLLERLSDVLARGEAAMLLLNRRGYSKVVLCGSCARSLKCPNCDVVLTPHRRGEELFFLCHWCGHEERGFSRCPACGGELKLLGYGVQRVEKELERLFPGARVGRMDRDTASGRFSRWRIIERMERGEIDILVGTQMIAKGHHFPRVTLSAVLLADLGMNIPDFRAAERTYQLLCQMAGRSGRGERPGEVVIQSYNLDHYAVRLGALCDYESFVEAELEARREMGFPPFVHLVRLIFVGANRERVKDAALEVASLLRDGDAEVLGPSPCPIGRLVNRYRWHLLLRHKSRKVLLGEAASVPHSIGSVRVLRDVDPQDFL